MYAKEKTIVCTMIRSAQFLTVRFNNVHSYSTWKYSKLFRRFVTFEIECVNLVTFKMFFTTVHNLYEPTIEI